MYNDLVRYITRQHVKKSHSCYLLQHYRLKERKEPDREPVLKPRVKLRVVTRAGNQVWEPGPGINGGNLGWEPEQGTKDGNQGWEPKV